MSEKNKNQKLVSYDEFNALISEEGEVNYTVYKSLLQKLKNTAYVTKSGKIKIYKLIADGQFGGVIRNVNTQILGKAAAKIFDFGNGIVVDEKLGYVLSLVNSIRNLDDCAKEMQTGGGKFYYNATEDPDGKKLCSFFSLIKPGLSPEERYSLQPLGTRSIKSVSFILNKVPNFKFMFCRYKLHGSDFAHDSIRNTDELFGLNMDLESLRSIFYYNPMAFGSEVLKELTKAGCEFETTVYTDEKKCKYAERCFKIKDARLLASYKNGKFKDLLNLDYYFFAENSITDAYDLLNKGIRGDIFYDLLNECHCAFTASAFDGIYKIPGVSFENKKLLITDANKLAGYNIGMFKSLCHGYYSAGDVRYMYKYFSCDSVKNVQELLKSGFSGLIGCLICYRSGAFTENAFENIPGVSFENKKFLITDANKLARYNIGMLKGLYRDYYYNDHEYFSCDSVKSVKELLKSGFSGLIIGRLIRYRSGAFTENAFENIPGVSFENKKFLITDANELARYNIGMLKGLYRDYYYNDHEYFSCDSVKSVKELLKSGFSDLIIGRLIRYRSDAFTKNAFENIPGVSFENKKFLITDANQLKNTEYESLLDLGGHYADDSVKNVQELLENGGALIRDLIRYQPSAFTKNAFKNIPCVSFENKKFLITDANQLENTEYKFLLDLGDGYYANDSVKNVKELLEKSFNSRALIKPLIDNQSSAFTENAFKNIPCVSFKNKKFLITDANKLKNTVYEFLLYLGDGYYANDSVKNVKEFSKEGFCSRELIKGLICYRSGAFTENAFQDIPGVSFKNKKFLITDANKLKNTVYEFLLYLGDEYYAKGKNKVVTVKNPEPEKNQKQKIDDKLTLSLGSQNQGMRDGEGENENKKSDQNITDVKNKIEVNEVKVVQQKVISEAKNESNDKKNKKSDQNITDIKSKIEVNEVKVVEQKGGSNKNLKAPQDMQKDGKVLLNFDNKNKDSGNENKTSNQNIADVNSETKIVEQKVVSEVKNIDSQIEVKHETKSPLDHNKITDNVPQNSQKPGNTTDQNSVVITQSTNKMTEINQQAESKENNGINKFQDIYDIDTYLSKTNFDTTNFKDSLKDVKVNLFDKLCVVIYMFFTHIHTLFGNKNYSVEMHAKLRKAYGNLKNQQQNNHNNTQPVSKQLNSMLISNEQKKTSVCDLFNHLRASAQTKNNNVLLATDNKTEVK